MSSQNVDFVLCPLFNRDIDLGYCMDIQNVVDDLVLPRILDDDIPEEKYGICKNCIKRTDLLG